MKPRKARKPCKIRGCEKPSRALGLCATHYGRKTRYGSPTITGRMGGPKTTPTAVTAAGITPRMVTHWADQGHLDIPVPENGSRRAWTAREVRVAVLIRKLTLAGIPLALAASCARSHVYAGRTSHPIGDGIALTTSETDQERAAGTW